jgi:hypothetical protein
MRAGADDLLQAGVHTDERGSTSGGLEKSGRVTVLRAGAIPGPRHETCRGFIDPGLQDDFYEWHPDGNCQPIQDLHELQAPEELGDEHIMTGPEMGVGHGAGQVPSGQA